MKANETRIPLEWRAYQRALTRLRATLEGEQATRAQAVREPTEPGGADFADRATDGTERATLLAEITQEAAELSEIDAALDRMRDGTYGVCEETGRPIEPARLQAIPWTRWCQEAAARRSGRATR